MKLLLVLPLMLLLAGCGDSDSKKEEVNPRTKAKRVIWEQVPPEFSPHIEENTFRTDGVERIKTNVFGYSDDVELIYSPNIAWNQVGIRMYRVFRESATWGGYYQNVTDRTLNISKSGTYSCGIQIQNGRITQLNGGCYVRMQIILPMGSEIEVENAGVLISKRFIAMDNKTFLEKVRRANWAEEKYAVIREYLASYGNIGRRASLLTSELQTVVHDFTWHKEKIEALRMLHTSVIDREYLAVMIDREFPFRDEKNEARRVVGLPPVQF